MIVDVVVVVDGVDACDVDDDYRLHYQVSGDIVVAVVQYLVDDDAVDAVIHENLKFFKYKYNIYLISKEIEAGNQDAERKAEGFLCFCLLTYDYRDTALLHGFVYRLTDCRPRKQAARKNTARYCDCRIVFLQPFDPPASSSIRNC